jgi:hypothetical protein
VLPFVIVADHNSAALALDGDRLVQRFKSATRQLDLFDISASAMTGQL